MSLQVRLASIASCSRCMAASQLGSLSAAHADVGIGESGGGDSEDVMVYLGFGLNTLTRAHVVIGWRWIALVEGAAGSEAADGVVGVDWCGSATEFDGVEDGGIVGDDVDAVAGDGMRVVVDDVVDAIPRAGVDAVVEGVVDGDSTGVVTVVVGEGRRYDASSSSCGGGSGEVDVGRNHRNGNRASSNTT